MASGGKSDTRMSPCRGMPKGLGGVPPVPDHRMLDSRVLWRSRHAEVPVHRESDRWHPEGRRGGSPDRRSGAQARECPILHPPGGPAQNAFIERFNRTYREEVLDALLLWVSTQEVQLSDAWLVTYNGHRPPRRAGSGTTTHVVGARHNALRVELGVAHLTGKLSFAFLWQPSVDASHWRADKGIRPAGVLRRLCGGSRTRHGADNQQVRATVVRTAANEI